MSRFRFFSFSGTYRSDALFCSLHHRRWDKISICPRAYRGDFVLWTAVISARFANCRVTFTTVK